jgi:hypothetical protein
MVQLQRRSSFARFTLSVGDGDVWSSDRMIVWSYDEFGQPLGSNEGEEGKGVIGKGDTCNFICNFGGVVGVGRDTECWSVVMEKCDMMAAF